MGSVVGASGLSFPVTGGILVPQAGIELVLPALQTRFLTTLPLGKTPTKSVIISYMCVYYPQVSISVSKFSLLKFHFSCGPRTISQFCRLKILRKFEHITVHITNKLPHPVFFHKGSHICPFIYIFLTANSPCQAPLAHNQTITVTS